MDAREQLRKDVSDLIAGKWPTPTAMFVLYEVDTGPYDATGATVHYVEGIVAPKPHSLAIAQLEPDLDGYYLFYRDEHGRNITDTFHESLGRAFAQAEFEYAVPRSAWAKVDRREYPSAD